MIAGVVDQIVDVLADGKAHSFAEIHTQLIDVSIHRVHAGLDLLREFGFVKAQTMYERPIEYRLSDDMARFIVRVKRLEEEEGRERLAGRYDARRPAGAT